MDQVHDVAIIGGGVVGCAILHRLTTDGYRCILLEKEPNLITGASSGNSGIYASGFDAARHTLEGKCLAQATCLNNKIFKQYNLPRGKPGAIIIATNDNEVKKLPDLLREAHEAGARDCRLLSMEEVHLMEPNLSDIVQAGMWVPGERSFDPWLLPITLAHVAKKGGAEILTDHEVLETQRRVDDIWEVRTKQSLIYAKTIINAAGLYADKVEALHGPCPFRIKPRLGEYIVYDKGAQSQLNHILFPVPTELGRGVLIFPSVHGNVIVGPTAENVDWRKVEPVSDSTVKSLKTYAERILPDLASNKIIGTYAGLRPATQFPDYQIKHHPESNWVTVGGIRSTGASACLAIAEYVQFLVKQALLLQPSQQPTPDNSAINWRVGNKGTVLMDSDVYQITHPITYFGLVNSAGNSKL